jgi:hypothetical protein
MLSPDLDLLIYRQHLNYLHSQYYRYLKDTAI